MHRYKPEAERTMTRKQVRDVDAWAIDTVGVPGVVLMENAGRSCAEMALELLKGVETPRVIIFCGTGNNGGDGYVIARHLLGSPCDVRVCLCGSPDRVRGDAKTNLDILTKMGHSVTVVSMDKPQVSETVRELAAGCDMVVDAVFGTGLSEDMRPEYVALIEAMNRLAARKLAVDIPSGLNCDTGRPMPAAFMADMTVTFVAAKAGFAEECSRRYTGEVYVASIGIEPE
jgi:NAD(P)H-hydrate epimerase